jgi:hypothetical protein
MAIASAPPAWANSARRWPEIMGKSLIQNLSCFLVIVNQPDGQKPLPVRSLSCDATGEDWSTFITAHFLAGAATGYDEAWPKIS